MIIDVADLAGTEALGRRLGQLLFPGAVVALVGGLGAGKTHLVRAIAEGLEIPDARIVSSPTFVLIQEYPARLRIHHFDAYRLSCAAEFAELGVHEYFQGEGVCLVEWADRVRGCLPEEYLEVGMTITGPTSRRIVLAARGQVYEELVERMNAPEQGGRPGSSNLG